MPSYEELDYCQTPLGELILRRREVLSLNRAVVYEVKLAGELLMSSIVNDAEIALATLGLRCAPGDARDVLVGGLGLGYTAKAALDAERVRSVRVIEYLERVIDWHERGLVPLGETLSRDDRCEFVLGDFFEAVGHKDHAKTNGDIAKPDRRRYHAILLDIDHSPQCLLHARNAAFYSPSGFAALREHLYPGGVFALWSADPPEESLLAALRESFETVNVEPSRFRNPMLDMEDVNYIVVAKRI